MIQYPTDPEFIAAMTDADLLATHERSTGQQNGQQATRLATEIDRWGLDVDAR